MKRLRVLGPLGALLLAACQTQPMRPATDEPLGSKPAPTPIAVETKTAPEQVTRYFLLPAEPQPLSSPDQILQRLRARFVDAPCRKLPRIEYWQGRYAGSPKRFSSQIAAILPMMATVLDALDRYHLPGEYALLPIAESWYRPQARGAGDHVGLWQIGRSTAHTLDLRVDATYDGRMDALASTDAALRYLAQLNNQFGDWRLAAAAYNVGPYRVQKLVDANDGAGFSHALREPSGLPSGTFEYLARIEALACLLGHSERFGIDLSEADRIDPLVAISLPPGQSSLKAIAEQQDIPVALLSALNPAFRQGFIASTAPRSLLIPESLADRLAQFELPKVAAPPPATIPTDKVHVVRAGDTLGAIARRHGVKLAQLFSLNGLTGRSVLRIGQRIRLAP
jgi:membrane-bound lytic murein transglycosylase D